jgi:hypothetical protein
LTLFPYTTLFRSEAGYTYELGEHRLKAVKFVNSRRWTTGAETALFAHSGVS